MNSFSTDRKHRVIPLTLVSLCAIGFLCAIGLRAYSAQKDRIAEGYAKRVPVRVERLTIRGVENAGKISDFLYRGAQPRGEGHDQWAQLDTGASVSLISES